MKRKRSLSISALVGVIAIVASFSSPLVAQTISIEHAQGKTQLEKNPQRLVVFDLASLDNLARLGLEQFVIGVPQAPLPDYLILFGDESYEKVGTLFEPDFESVAALEPDLVIVAGRSQAKYADLARIAPTIDLSVDNEHYLESVRRNIRILGELFDKQSQSQQEIIALEHNIEQLRAQTANKDRGLLILTTGGKMSAYGPGSRFGILHSAFGVQPAAPDISVGNHGQPISFEFILETNPDWLFVIDRDAAIGRGAGAARQLLDNPVVNKTIAAQKGQIIYLNPQNWYLVSGGLSSLHQTIEQIRTVYVQAPPS